MADVGLNEIIKTASREFHLQTSTLVDEGVIRTEVFEKGQILFVVNHQFERRTPVQADSAESRLRHMVDKFHQSIIEEIDSLFEISEQVFEEENPVAHERIGQVFLFTHIFDKAEKHFTKAIELDPERHGSFVYLGRCYFMQKRYNRAEKILSQILDRKIKYPDLYNMVGLVMMKKEDFRQALQYFKEALKQNAAYVEAYFNLAETILYRVNTLKEKRRIEDLKQSIKFLKIILKKIDDYGNVDDRNHCSLTKKALVKLDTYKALMLLREYRENAYIRNTPPEVIGFKFQLRLLYSAEEMSTEVLENYEEEISRALQKNPSYPDLWHYLALIHLMQCRHYFLKGLDNFRDATRINPQFDKAVKNLRLVENDGREFLALIKTIA